MQLVGYQGRYLEKLYEVLVDEGRQVVSFTGPKGCGKSTIIEELADQLKENWKVFLIAGTGEISPPYYTWYSAAQSAPLFGKTLVSEISLGVNFQPVGLPLGFEVSLGLGRSAATLNSNEQAIIKGIRRESNSKDHILIVAEDFKSWDPASIELLNKISLHDTEILADAKCIHVLIVDDEPVSTIAETLGVTPFDIHIDSIAVNDIQEVLLQQPFIEGLKLHDLESIIQFTGYDLRLINMAVHYQQETPAPSKIGSLSELLETRITNMPAEQKAVCRTLEHVSIINKLFSEKEAAYLLGQEPIQTEKLLDDAVNMNLIRKRHAYDFPNREIQQYFEDKLATEKKYLHHRFSQYLQTHYPEDYLERAYHLCLSEDANSDKNVLEAAYLMAIEIVRRNELTGGAPELLLGERLSEILSFLPSPIVPIVQSNIKTYIDAFNNLYRCEYHEAIAQLGGLNLMYAPSAFSTEVYRIMLLGNVQLADDLLEIKRLADELFASISEPDFCEDEIWCRSALVLLEVYGDRHVLPERFRQLRRTFEDRCRQHMFQSAFQALNARYACKAALFYNSMIAIKLTDESCDYYRTYNSTPNLYYGLCNNAANRMVCGEYAAAAERLQECTEILEDNPDIRFPSTYKIENNKVINSFLTSEGAILDYSARNRDRILPSAAAAAEALNRLRDKQGYEVSHVIEFNLLSMLMLAGDNEAASLVLKQLELEYRHLDAFYRYYYHSAKIAQHVMDGQHDRAAEQLHLLENQEVILLAGFTKVLNKRNQIIAHLIQDEFHGDAYDYNYEFIRRGFRIQDPSSSFWGRGLLLSDLQFLSI